MDQPEEDRLADRWAQRVRLDGTLIYGIAFGGRSRDQRLMKVAPATGGWFFEPNRNTDFTAEAERILSDLRGRYLLGFVPVAFDGKEHTISVKVRRPGVVVRARTAYLAPTKPQ